MPDPLADMCRCATPKPSGWPYAHEHNCPVISRRWFDPLADALTATGIDPDVVIDVVERAAIIQYDAGKSRWKAGIEAQQQVLGEVVTKAHDI